MLGQRFTNYGPRTTCGPRDLPFWSFKKYRRKIKIQMHCISHYGWKSQRLEMTHGNRLSPFSQYWHFMKFITLHRYRLPTLLLEAKERFKALWTWCCPCTSGAAPVTQPGTTRIHNSEPKYRTFSYIYDIVNSFADPNLHIEMITYCTACINNRTCQIAYKYTGNKICYKINKSAFEGKKSKVVRGSVLT